MSSSRAVKREDFSSAPKFFCNICRNDIAHEPRVKCLQCKSFDMCMDCFRMGAEIFPHSSSHKYMVIEKLDYPLFEDDWLAIEEVLLLDGIASCGLDNWADIANYVGSKTADECCKHYYSVYYNERTKPLPDHNRILRFPPDVLQRRYHEAIARKESERKRSEDQKEPEPITIKNFPKSKIDEIYLSVSYNPKRGEFLPEWRWFPEAETILQNMAFSSSDTEDERRIKQEALRGYYEIVSERDRRTRFLNDRELFDFRSLEKKVEEIRNRERNQESPTDETRNLVSNMRPLLQIFSRNLYYEMIEYVCKERALYSSIEDLRRKREGSVKMDKTLRERPGDSVSPPPGKKVKTEGMKACDMEGASLLLPEELEVCDKAEVTPAQYQMAKLACMRMEARKGSKNYDFAGASDAAKLPQAKMKVLLDYFRKEGWVSAEVSKGKKRKPEGGEKKTEKHKKIPSTTSPPPPLPPFRESMVPPIIKKQ